MRPRRSASTCCAVVGDTWPERFADGATSGRPTAARMSRATGWLGTRTAMVSRPAVASSATGQSGTPGQHQGQRAGPERRREPLGGGVEARERARGGSVGHVGDQRIERRSALGLIEAGDRLGVGGVGAEPVDGLGREGDEAARGQHARGQRGRRATLGRTVPGRLRLYHSGCRWRGHRGYLCLRRRGRRL